jgi:O-antigen ligase
LHPIELGVVAGVVLPIAVAVALRKDGRGPIRRWLPVGFLASSIPVSVSRSALIAVAVGLGLLVVLLPPAKRVVALFLAPVAVGAVFLGTPGYIGTLGSFITMGSDDSSITARIDDYPLVERLVRAHPWFGTGGGTYIPANPLDIFDNQYLKALVELGVVGLIGLVLFLVLPVVTAMTARRRSTDLDLRTICAALAGSAAAGATCSFTFDSMSFATFSGTFALVVGLIGACWVIAQRERVLTCDDMTQVRPREANRVAQLRQDAR